MNSGEWRQRGQAVVETALAITVFLMIVMAIIDFGRAAYTYNAMSNLAREASHYAMIEYTSDTQSPCYWSTLDKGSCLDAIKSYALSLGMSPLLSSLNLSVAMTINCGNGVACDPGIPIEVSMGYHFQPVATQLLGLSAFDISASSTNQFVLPAGTPTPAVPTPGGTTTPLPTPTVIPEGAATGVTVAPGLSCTSNCQVFTVSWTPPANVPAIGHYDIYYGSAGNYIQSDPIAPVLSGNNTTSTTVNIGNPTHALCFEVLAVFADGTQYPATGSWHDTSGSAPVC
jgi:TadE-like protein